MPERGLFRVYGDRLGADAADRMEHAVLINLVKEGVEGDWHLSRVCHAVHTML